MSSIRQGDVVLVKYPYTDWTDAKQRPSLVVSSTSYNQETRRCVLMPITSQVNKAPESREVLISGQEIAQSGLYKTSLIKADILFTFEQSMIVKQIGSVPPGALQKALAVLQSVFE